MFDFSSRVVSSLSESEKREVRALLASQDLDFEEGADRVALVEDADGAVAGTASLFGDVIRMVAVSDEHQEYGLSAVAISALLEVARARGTSHLFVYTKRDMAPRFASLGFRGIAQTEAVSLLETGEPGIGTYRAYLEDNRIEAPEGGTIGAIVVNCNPFTRGHRYLIGRASQECALLYVVVVEADLSFFSFADRYAMVKLGTADLGNVKMLRSGPYAVSAATFPTYFLKDKGAAAVSEQQARLDVDLFLRLYVRSLLLDVRFVGTERDCPVTAIYNGVMSEVLPGAGVAVREIERLRTDSGEVVSASTVRRMLAAGERERLGAFLPPSTTDYLRSIGTL